MALSEAANTPEMASSVGMLHEMPMAASTTIYQGGLVAINSSGYAVPASATTGLVHAGVATETKTNSGSAGAAYIKVRSGIFRLGNKGGDLIDQADVGRSAYIEDDETVRATSSGTSVAGRVIAVDSAGVWVQCGLATAAVDAADAVVEKRTVTVGHADLTDADTSQTVNIGAVLPANARILGVSVHTVTAFSGGSVSALALDIGTSGDVDAIVDGAALHSAAVDGQVATLPSGIAPNKLFASAGAQLIATFVSTGDNLVNLTAGACTIDVLYTVLA